MIEVLITGSVIVTGREVVRDGYVYVKNGRILAVGSGTPPEDYTFAHLILGGHGRIIAPALTAIVDAPAYPWRLRLPRLADRAGLYRSLSRQEASTASLPAVYEAHVHGISRIVVEYHDPWLASDLAGRVGGFYHTARPACLEGRGDLTVAGEGCEGEADITYPAGDAGGHGRVLALVGRPVVRPQGPGVWEASENLRRLLGLQPGEIREGRIAEIAVYNTSRPPAMFLHQAPDEAIAGIHSLGLRVETLLAGEAILVDQGEHLYIAEKQFSEASRLAGRR